MSCQWREYGSGEHGTSAAAPQTDRVAQLCGVFAFNPVSHQGSRRAILRLFRQQRVISIGVNQGPIRQELIQNAGGRAQAVSDLRGKQRRQRGGGLGAPNR